MRILKIKLLMAAALSTVMLASCSQINNGAMTGGGHGQTTYFEGFEPKTSSMNKNWRVVTRADYSEMLASGKPSRVRSRSATYLEPAAENKVPILLAHTSSSPQAVLSDSPANSTSYETVERPDEKPNYSHVSAAELDCADDLKTMREAKMVWTVGGATKGAVLGGIFGALTAALSGGGADAIREQAIAGAFGGGVVGGMAGRQQGEVAGRQTVAKKHQARRTEAELSQEINNAQKFNDSVTRVNAKLQAQLSMAKDSSGRKTMKKSINNALAQVDDQIKSMTGFINDDSASAAHGPMAEKLRTLNQLKASIKETESMMSSARA